MTNTYLEEFKEEIIKAFDHLKALDNYVANNVEGGDVIWVDFDGANHVDEDNTNGDMTKIRPAIVFQSNATSRNTTHVMVVPIQSSSKRIVGSLTPAVHLDENIHGVLQVASMQSVNKQYIVNKAYDHEDYDYKQTYSAILHGLRAMIM